MTPDERLSRARPRPVDDDQGAQMLGRVILGTLAVCVLAVIVWGLL